MPPDPLAIVRSASVGEVAWLDEAGSIRVRGALPLVSESGPVLAFPYADAAVARSVGAASEVLLTLTEPRSAGTAFEPTLLRCHPRVSEDRDGARFTEDLLDQELRRYPPSRLFADSPLLRREHWWWLPRVIVDLTVVSSGRFHERESPEDHLLVVADPAPAGEAPAHQALRDRLAVAIARTRSHDPLRVDALDSAPAPGPAVLFGQDASFPDMERWVGWSWRGDWDGESLTASTSPHRVGLPPPRGVMARWRHQRDLEKRCRQALDRA